MSQIHLGILVGLMTAFNEGAGDESHEFYQRYIENAKLIARVDWITEEVLDRTDSSDGYIEVVIADAHRGIFLTTLIYTSGDSWNLWHGGRSKDVIYQIECRNLSASNDVDEIITSIPQEDVSDYSSVGKIAHGMVLSVKVQYGQQEQKRQYHYNSSSDGRPDDVELARKRLDNLVTQCFDSAKSVIK